eukprot:440130-Amphidinium_carterae.1
MPALLLRFARSCAKNCPAGVGLWIHHLVRVLAGLLGALSIWALLGVSVGLQNCEAKDMMENFTFWVNRACIDQDNDPEKMRIIKTYLEDG